MSFSQYIMPILAQLCETCFFYALTVLKKAKRDHHMFDEAFNPAELEGFGLK
ncbi:hypothetical protein ACFODO_14055 [Acinetobacter sichuanensis]|uniref:DUF1127 domain-containing protein n=1 Tax=Acinetobacter sichuanensis TaxID=2136183 RepID=A0ABV7BHT3_9GAMM|nr:MULTISPECIES: hypothetical protein [Acinetobacter]MDM1769309.1 hypothetical protein [Acinetobacter sp. 226-4]